MNVFLISLILLDQAAMFVATSQKIVWRKDVRTKKDEWKTFLLVHIRTSFWRRVWKWCGTHDPSNWVQTLYALPRLIKALCHEKGKGPDNLIESIFNHKSDPSGNSGLNQQHYGLNVMLMASTNRAFLKIILKSIQNLGSAIYLVWLGLFAVSAIWMRARQGNARLYFLCRFLWE